jgi:nitroreductase
MLQELIDQRYSAKIFHDTVIEEDKINYILDCALKAPSKQSIYPYKIFVLGNSKKATKFKEWMFYQDTWCAAGARADIENKTPDNTRFNGQYNAPLVFLYAHRESNNLNHVPIDQTQFAWKKEADLIDMTVSASFAMLAAEEQGLRTCFGRCHSYEYINTILGEGSVRIGMALGMGYADSVDNDSKMITPIIDDTGVIQGYDINNLEQTYPIKKHNVRRNKPDIKELFTFI